MPVIKTGFKLARAAYTAAVYPAGPDPKISTLAWRGVLELVIATSFVLQMVSVQDISLELCQNTDFNYMLHCGLLLLQ
ncbi:hypothetical protein LMED105_00390 [Limnobacter sp. MED105]|jgi:hypothetical protein|nr:hypothetical protein LMED105_00390 [Limnobacter sp. MED105]|tara:strand:- start:745 stop:978 length:234 start_codon:yes stop_codon:yes gene_type:complete